VSLFRTKHENRTNGIPQKYKAPEIIGREIVAIKRYTVTKRPITLLSNSRISSKFARKKYKKKREKGS
jgi:hypothetical protein